MKLLTLNSQLLHNFIPYTCTVYAFYNNTVSYHSDNFSKTKSQIVNRHCYCYFINKIFFSLMKYVYSKINTPIYINILFIKLISRYENDTGFPSQIAKILTFCNWQNFLLQCRIILALYFEFLNIQAKQHEYFWMHKAIKASTYICYIV